ncbi:unnamed protein product, partial [Choristocarpus tenellus]
MYSVEGDGVFEHLYEFLWCKDELNFRPAINVPDTIVYKFGQPVNWYFTGVDGKVKKKLKTNIINSKIEETFNRKVLGSDVVAYYISWESTDKTSTGVNHEDKTGTSIEYMDRPGLHNFLFNHWKGRNGILQRFIEPKGTKNALVRAIWSPKMCLLERRVNSHQLHDQRYGLYERSVTYDGPDIYSTAFPLRGTVLPTQVQRCCDSLVTHVGEVSFQKVRICRMSINFKFDSRDRVWLLWSNSIRVANEVLQGHKMLTSVRRPVNINEQVKIPPHIKMHQEAAHGPREMEITQSVECSSCARRLPNDSFHAVHYKTIITHFNHVVDLVSNDPTNRSGTVEWPPSQDIIAAAGGVGFGNLEIKAGKNLATLTAQDVTIPPVIRLLHPKLAVDSYSRHRRDPLFLYKTTLVCEDCFLVYAELASLAFRASGRQALRDHTISTHYSAEKRSQTLSRCKVSPSEWQPLSREATVQSSRVLRQSKSQPIIRQKNSPQLPEVIRSEDTSLREHNAQPEWNQPVEEIIRQREDKFFQDLGSANVSKEYNPLVHLVASQRKMGSLGMPKNKVNPNPAFEKARKTDQISPYSQPLVLVEYLGASSNARTRPTVQQEGAVALGHANRKSNAKKEDSKSATIHQEFLSKTLEEVEEQLHSKSLMNISAEG